VHQAVVVAKEMEERAIVVKTLEREEKASPKVRGGPIGYTATLVLSSNGTKTKALDSLAPPKVKMSMYIARTWWMAPV